MKTGSCRHCGSSPVAIDAPYCPACAGVGPNPGIWTQWSVKFNILLGSLMLLLPLGIFSFFPNGVVLLYTFPFFVAGCVTLKQYLLHPYG